MSTKGAVAAAQRAYDEQGIRGDYVTVSRDHYTVVGRGRDGHTAITDIPRTGRVHDAVTQASESLDALFRSFRLGTNQPGRGRDSMFPQKSMITMMRGGHDTFADAPPVILNARDSGPARKRTKPEPEREPEDEILSHLDTLGALLLREFPGFTAKAVAFDQEVRRLVQERQKIREAAAGTEFDQLTEQCRVVLEKVRKLEGERDEIRMDRNRALPLANAATQKLARLKQQKPSDDEFPTRAEVAAWQTALSKARAEADEAQRPVDDLLAALRAKTAEISISKSELAALKEKRNAARRRLDPAYVPAEADNESETLRVL